MALKIIPFEPKYANLFRDLNLNWLEKFFFVEEKDKELLNDSQKFIVDKGGFIFMATLNSEVVGCYSLQPYSDSVFELGKMAVAEGYQGQKIGQLVLQHAISFAKTSNWDALVLYSSTKLPTALHIYRKYGFEHIALEKDLPYKRSDVKMILNLKQ